MYPAFHSTKIHDQHRDKAGQPEALTHLRRDTLSRRPDPLSCAHHRVSAKA